LVLVGELFAVGVLRLDLVAHPLAGVGKTRGGEERDEQSFIFHG
jgi:hypothetical protein